LKLRDGVVVRLAVELSNAPGPAKKTKAAFRVALLALLDDRLNLSHSPCCRASLAMSVCICALAPRGAPRLLAQDTTPKQSHFESPGVFVPLRLAKLLASYSAKSRKISSDL
jgi:hypothetical protein